MVSTTITCVRFSFSALFVGFLSSPALSDADWELKALLEAEFALSGICEGSASDNADMRGYSCQARQVVAMALTKAGWCYGKEGQISSQMEWHKCGSSSYKMGQDMLHAYDWDEKAQSFK